MSPARRRFLRAAGAASFGFIGGCAGRSKPTPAPSPTPGGRGNEDGATDPPKPSQRVRTVGGGRVALTDAVARKAVAYESLMGSGGVLAPSEAQFVVCELRPESDAAPPIGAFSLVVGDASFAPADVEADRGGRTASLAGLGGQEYGAAGDAGWIAFTLPRRCEPSTPKSGVATAARRPRGRCRPTRSKGSTGRTRRSNSARSRPRRPERRSSSP